MAELEYQAFEVGCLGHRAVNRVIRSLEARIDESGQQMLPGRCQRCSRAQILEAEVLGTGTGHEISVVSNKAAGQSIEAAISLDALFHVPAAFDEGRWIDADNIKFPSGIT